VQLFLDMDLNRRQLGLLRPQLRSSMATDRLRIGVRGQSVLKKIGQKRFRDPAPQTRRFLSVSIIGESRNLSNARRQSYTHSTGSVGAAFPGFRASYLSHPSKTLERNPYEDSTRGTPEYHSRFFSALASRASSRAATAARLPHGTNLSNAYARRVIWRTRGLRSLERRALLLKPRAPRAIATSWGVLMEGAGAPDPRPLIMALE